MATAVFSVFLLALSCSVLPSTLADCQEGDCPTDPDEVFAINPENRTVNSGETISFTCMLTAALRSTMNDFPGWEYMVINDTQFRTVTTRPGSDSIELGFNLTNDGDTFVINDVQPIHAGRYRCRPFLSCCDSRSFVAEFFLRVTGPPVINLNNDSVCVDTLKDLELNGTIAGFPSPNVVILRAVNGVFRVIDQSANQRFTSSFDDINARLSVRIEDVLRRDMGMYKIMASNEHGEDEAIFTVIPKGPDPPILSLTPLVVVSQFSHRVWAMCSIQQDAFEEPQATTIEWMDMQGILVPPPTASNTIFANDHRNGSVSLTISSLNVSFVGTYICRARNIRDEDSGILMVFGPPPSPPMNPNVMKVNNNIIISWTRPTSSDVVITSYAIDIYTAGTDAVLTSFYVNVSTDQNEASFTFSPSSLGAGNYEVTVSSFNGTVRGGSTGRSSFVVGPGADSFPLIIVVVVAVVAAVIILSIVVGIAVGLYCYCSYNARRNKNTHQQRWGSEEDKLNHPQPAVPTVQNTYTALALHDSPELPPSPLSPMTSAIGIDPKWEFPRENIQLSDVLAEGQFTVLYKGVARNLKEKPCDVAVKSLKEDATEDDLKALIYEMDLLSSIEEHPSIVSLVRVCSVGKPLYMVMEYMCHGDLLGFLRACRGHHGMYTISPGNRYQPPSLQLCSRDLLNMATKIASGMRYLADRKIVHRALCTRNVLVGSGMDVKIYNVGSFDVTLDSRDGGMVKWMAPETLYDGTNTTYSDVWSFGVTLWELVTVGGTPYDEVLPEDLYAQLQGGMRMPCPTHCAEEVYSIMSACWQKNPTDRPHFAIIHDELDELVMSKLNYLDLRSYDGYAYSQFGDEAAQLSTAL